MKHIQYMLHLFSDAACEFVEVPNMLLKFVTELPAARNELLRYNSINRLRQIRHLYIDDKHTLWITHIYCVITLQKCIPRKNLFSLRCTFSMINLKEYLSKKVSLSVLTHQLLISYFQGVVAVHFSIYKYLQGNSMHLPEYIRVCEKISMNKVFQVLLPPLISAEHCWKSATDYYKTENLKL